MPHPAMKRKANRLRLVARGRECQIRIPGVCNGDNSTVVLCHLPGGGMARKQPDLCAAWGCAACHDAVDGRSKTDYPREVLKLWHLEGVIRTQQALLDEGIVRI